AEALLVLLAVAVVFCFFIRRYK
ncbi:hypothetical protein UFOVP1035_1, partial [uncultured Caudovirales phage]